MPTLIHVADRVLNRPLLITPEKATIILQVLSGRIGLSGPEANRFEGDQPIQTDEDGNVVRSPITGLPKLKPYRLAGNVGIVSIVGSLVNRGAWVGASSGLVSYEGIQTQLKAVAADPKAESIILDIQSPGGEAVGAFETASMVRSIASEKRVVAVVNGMAASAAYAIASGASEIVTIETGVVGSIGVVLLHADYSQMLAEEGIKPTLIFAGAHKVDGNPYEPLPESVRADLQAEVDAFYKAFLTAVAAGRGPRLTADMAHATEARTLIGQAAVDAGLADAVGTFESVLEDLTSSAPRSGASADRSGVPGAPGGRNQSQQRSMSMSDKTSAPAADAGTYFTQAQLDEAIKAAEQRGRTEAQAAADAAVSAERERLAGLDKVLADAGPGAAEIVAKAKEDGKTTPAEAALQVLQAGAHKAGVTLAGLEADEASAKGAVPGAEGAGKTKTPQTPDGWKAEWEASDKLQAEFPTVDSYVGYMQGTKAGAFRVLKPRDAA